MLPRVFVVALLGVIGCRAGAETLWRQYGFNAAHTSYNDAETILADWNVGRLALFWTSDTFQGVATAPILGFDAIFVANDGRVRALGKRSGRQRWTRLSCSAEHTVQPALGRRILIVGDGGGDLAGYEPATGNQIVCDDESGSIVSAPAVADDTVFFTNSGEVIAVDQFTSRDHWRADTGSSTTPALANGVVFLTGEDSVFAF